MAKSELAPPVHTLLAYAADGWAAQRGCLNPSGKPKPPAREEWLPVVGALVQEPDGLDRLRDLTLTGMAAWGVDPAMMASVSGAFSRPDIADQLTWRLGTLASLRPQPVPPPPAKSREMIAASETGPHRPWAPWRRRR